MAKEKNYNPVQAAKKAEKAKTLKKQKAQVQSQRTEKLARRNPARIQRDIDALKEAEQSGSLRPHEKQRLQELEKDLAAVNKAREALGEKAPQFKPPRDDNSGDRGVRGGRGGARGGRGGVLGKRTRDGGWKGRDGEESSDTDADVKDIPMPRDTPPPIPNQRGKATQAEVAPPEPKKVQIVYEAAPQVRNLMKEATRFMPTAVAQKMKLAKGEGRLLEPEEFDKLKEEGYMNEGKKDVPAKADSELDAFLSAQGVDVAAKEAAEAAVQEAEHEMIAAEASGEIVDKESEAKTAENKLRQVEIEEVEDEDY
ncbi:hypothetical protein DM02DRAFT_357170 [Periconia macrospinosa]|uniref:Wbp11/ELF5/Saf1 N-terminal domain-containing protein n=1 Tax=Periconia macrospinosa TaxID=97972 RepID=A0A2V1EAP6_9PLEO|nr:hypothetical protein DM02DRAFT_357170 [Periconia macrospinosa]